MKYLIIGGSGTIGAAIGRRLSDVAHVTNASRTAAGWTTQNVFVDLARPDAELVVDGLSAYDGLVLAAGVDSLQGAVEYTTDVAELVLRINATVPLAIAARYCRDRCNAGLPAAVVAISSDTLSGDVADAMAYSSSKAALEEGLRLLAVDERLPSTTIRAVRAGFVGRSMAGLAEGGHRSERGSADEVVLDRVVDVVVRSLRADASSERYAAVLP